MGPERRSSASFCSGLQSAYEGSMGSGEVARTFRANVHQGSSLLAELTPEHFHDPVHRALQEHLIAGVAVHVFSPAKTVADCFKYRNKVGLDVALEALRDCWRHRRVIPTASAFHTSSGRAVTRHRRAASPASRRASVPRPC